MTFQGKVQTMNEWVRRRKNRGEHPNADAIWAHIKALWPTNKDEQEQIFQGIKR